MEGGALMELPPKPADVSAAEFVRLLTTYVFARPVVCGRRILDIGCGSGHGVWLLASGNRGEGMVSIDISAEGIEQVSRMCRDVPGFEARVMDAQKITFEDGSFPRVTCFEVIEHLPAPSALLERLGAVLSRDGILLISTPNRSRRVLPFQRPPNEEHVREYRLGEFRRLLRRYFPAVHVLGVYGRPDLHEFFVRDWRPNAAEFYLGPLRRLWRFVKSMIPTGGKDALKRLLRRGGASGMAASGVGAGGAAAATPEVTIPQPVPEEWPFCLGEADRGCLNFVAVCGFDAEQVAATAARMRDSSAAPWKVGGGGSGFNSARYWEERYRAGQDSGVGSYGQLAEFKAEVINEFVQANGVRSVIEFGCGDGNQLSLARYPSYVGLDVSPAAVEMCRRRFSGDATKRFAVYTPAMFPGREEFSAELGLSLDVLFHLVEDNVREAHLTHLFEASRRFVIIYTWDPATRLPRLGEHERVAEFRDFIAKRFQKWTLVREIGNRYPYDPATNEGSCSSFYIYAAEGNHAR